MVCTKDDLHQIAPLGLLLSHWSAFVSTMVGPHSRSVRRAPTVFVVTANDEATWRDERDGDDRDQVERWEEAAGVYAPSSHLEGVA